MRNYFLKSICESSVLYNQKEMDGSFYNLCSVVEKSLSAFGQTCLTQSVIDFVVAGHLTAMCFIEGDGV